MGVDRLEAALRRDGKRGAMITVQGGFPNTGLLLAGVYTPWATPGAGPLRRNGATRAASGRACCARSRAAVPRGEL